MEQIKKKPAFSFPCTQLQHDLAKLRNSPRYGRLFSLETIFEKWQLFCEKPPKGFEKYFKPGGAAAAAGKDGKDAPPPPPPATSKTPPLSKPPGADAAKPKSSSDWNFGMFGPSAGKSGGGGGAGGSGRPIGEGNDREKWLLLGALGIVGLIGTLTFMEINYKEIGWKEFVNKYVNIRQFCCLIKFNILFLRRSVIWPKEWWKNWRWSTRNGFVFVCHQAVLRIHRFVVC